MLVVGDAEVPSPGAVPVAEEHREGAPSRAEEGRVAVGRADRSEQPVVGAIAVLPAVLVQFDVHADRQRREFVLSLPGGAEACGPLVASVEAQSLVRPLKPALADAPEEDVLPEAEDGEIGMAIRVEVDGVGAGYVGEIRPRVEHLAEPKRTGDRAVVAVESCRVGPTGEVEVGLPIIVTVEHGNATPNEERPVPVVCVVDAGGVGLFDETRRSEGFGRCGRSAGCQ